MGFNKRHISKELLLKQYMESGIDGVKTCLRGGDALIYDDVFSAVIVSMYADISESYDISSTWSNIEQEILNELPN
jgi:hypothetical protein